MGFVSERISEKDWELYNSFELINKSMNIGEKQIADKYSGWIVDRERQIYFILTGVIGRENVEYYTLVWKGKKVNIVAGLERRFGDGMKKGYKVSGIFAHKDLENYEDEFLDIIKEALQVGWEKTLDFIEFVKPIYREEIK